MKHRISRSERITIRGLRYNVRHWGAEGSPVVFFLHGWMDASPTFQFVVDALAQDWHIIAPDWRGYGDSEWLSRPYWFPDYYADLHEILAHYSPGRPARLVGHSMGANIAGIYAGACPKRVAQLVMLDFLGLKPAPDEDSPTLIGRWLRHLARTPSGGAYPHCEAFARRFIEMNPRLSEARAAFLSQHLCRFRDDGSVELNCDPWHRVPSPMVYHAEDNLACWQRIEAPVLLAIASHGYANLRFGNDPPEFDRRVACFRDVRVVTIEDTGHNVQHDQPEQVARAIEGFLSRD
ncbi:alpha/beta hydrolase [uncultured Propionivibrio sp.]|uniref:alpha/beta fold hydrolase n=1 Tax=uncultured Propionivibrio sp. TaxID=426737 RepID=UPI0029C0A3DB|nr:alpha/beta hydrolase [uncultured Propionivibrio sp.]